MPCENRRKGYNRSMKEKYYSDCIKVLDEVGKVVIGKDDCIRSVMAAVLAEGHILIDDVPGVGKTSLATAFAKAMGLENKRTQFTSDVMPADITGFNMYDNKSQEFIYQPGPVMCNYFLADEINRTSPKTQSALLEVMEEKSVTVDGVTRKVPEPFIVIATQNPEGSIGTQLLPESQLDRFMICISMGYPSLEDEIKIAKNCEKDYENVRMSESVASVIDGEELLNIRKYVKDIFIADEVYDYICRLIRATRGSDYIRLGVSPRGTIALTKLSKAFAFLDDRDYVTPKDVKEAFEKIAPHRIVMSGRASGERISSQMAIKKISNGIKAPGIKKKK